MKPMPEAAHRVTRVLNDEMNQGKAAIFCLRAPVAPLPFAQHKG